MHTYFPIIFVLHLTYKTRQKRRLIIFPLHSSDVMLPCWNVCYNDKTLKLTTNYNRQYKYEILEIIIELVNNNTKSNINYVIFEKFLEKNHL